MWAPTFPVSFGFSSSKTELRCSSIVSGQPPRFSSSDSQNQASGEDIGGLGHAVLNAVQSQSLASIDFPNSKTLDRKNVLKEGEQSIQKQRRESEKEERELSGSEVLLALHKARARRSQRLKPVKKKTGSQVEGGGATAVDYSNVRPLIVKSDWGVRLEELERRLQELINA